MYKVTEVFEYLVNDNTSFLSAHDILDWVAGMTCPLWDGYQDMLPKNSEGEEEYIPWGKSELSSVNLSNDKAFIDKKVLLMLIQNSEKLEALDASRVKYIAIIKIGDKYYSFGYWKTHHWYFKDKVDEDVDLTEVFPKEVTTVIYV